VPDWNSADFWAAEYDEFGTLAVLTLEAGIFPDVRAIDETAGITTGGAVQVETELPGARLIARDLAELGILPSQLDGGDITLNGRTWEIESHQVQSTVGGQYDGEVHLTLELAG
jgi:hypothetical protein